jgi:hypothetical protein
MYLVHRSATTAAIAANTANTARATPLYCIYIARAETKSRLPFLRSS